MRFYKGFFTGLVLSVPFWFTILVIIRIIVRGK